MAKNTVDIELSKDVKTLIEMAEKAKSFDKLMAYVRLNTENKCLHHFADYGDLGIRKEDYESEILYHLMNSTTLKRNA